MLRSAALLALTGAAAARKGDKGRTPILGWNTWCTEDSCGVDWCTSKEILDVAATIKSTGLQAIGYDHINLDDCWGERDATTNKIIGDPARFPEGMPAFIAKLHAMDFRFGLYTDIGPKGCHAPFTGSYPNYQQDADTFAEWKVRVPVPLEFGCQTELSLPCRWTMSSSMAVISQRVIVHRSSRAT
jgi:alpha-galactosidase